MGWTKNLAQYRLIIRDATYIVLLQEAAKQGVSLGKFLNGILDKTAEDLKGGVVQQAVCIVCGKPAAEVGFGAGQQRLFVCELHLNRLDGLGGRRTIETF